MKTFYIVALFYGNVVADYWSAVENLTVMLCIFVGTC